jgi:3',5'-cyclic AMP phosphodiesterase CpdA
MMTRSEFIRSILSLAGVSLGVGAASCGEDSSYGGNGGSTGDAACAETIAANHGHVLEVTAADVTAAVEKTYDIRGAASHSHSVTITAADFATLAGGTGVQIVSTTGDGHTHTVSVSCA